jgi:hypothetical protein
MFEFVIQTFEWERHKKNEEVSFFQINESTRKSVCLIGNYEQVLPNIHAGNLESDAEKHCKIEYTIIT